MEKFPEIKGVILTTDPSDLPDGMLVGGRNMLKRLKRGLIRRPGFGAFDVESAAALKHGSSITNPRATFPFAFGGGDHNVMGMHDGFLRKYDSSDSFDVVTKNLSDSIPTVAELGGYGLIASGLSVLKYDGADTPSPLGSKLIDDGEDEGLWSGVDADTTDFYSGTQSLKLASTGAGTDSGSRGDGSWDNNQYGAVQFIGLGGGDRYDFAQLISEQSLIAGVTVDAVTFNVNSLSGTNLTENTIVSIQYADASGEPDGAILASEAVLPATINSVGDKKVTFSSPPALTAGKDWCVVLDSHASETGLVYIGAQNYGIGGASIRINDGAWTYQSTASLSIVVFYATADLALDLYTGYPNLSDIVFYLHTDDGTRVTISSSTYIRFGDGTNYFEYQIKSTDITTDSWVKVAVQRGSKDGSSDSEFTTSGTPDWSSITQIDLSAQFSDTAQLNIDLIHLKHRWAPPDSGKVFVADGRAWVPDGRKLYYSEKWNPNVFYVDTYLEFPDNVVAVVDAGGMILVLTESEVFSGAPLSQFPDYYIETLAPFGCIDSKAVCEVMLKDRKGAAWISKNAGVMFWDGANEPFTISIAINEIFTDGGTNNKNFSYARSDETMMFFNERHKELWILYPTLLTGESNLKYGWVLDCSSGQWMPRFEWNGTNNIVYACMYRDSNDNLYKVLLTDSTGAVFHEGYVGSTRLSATTSKDGYVDVGTTGGAVKGYGEWPYMSNEKAPGSVDTVWHEVHIKYAPLTTEAFSLDFDYRVAAKGEGVDKDTYPNEEQISFVDTWTDIGARSTTLGDADTVVERNVKMPEDVKGHALGVRAGQVDSGGAAEWELIGLSVHGEPRHGKR